MRDKDGNIQIPTYNGLRGGETPQKIEKPSDFSLKINQIKPKFETDKKHRVIPKKSTVKISCINFAGQLTEISESDSYDDEQDFYAEDDADNSDYFKESASDNESDLY